MRLEIFFWVFKLFKESSPKLVWVAVLSNLLRSILQPISLLVLALLVDLGVGASEVQGFSIVTYLLIAVIYFTLSLILPNIFDSFNQYIEGNLNRNLQEKLTPQILDKSAKINLEELEKPEYQDMLARVRNVDSLTIVGYWNKNLGIVFSLVQLLFVITLLSSFYWGLAVVWIISALPDLYFRFKTVRKQHSFYNQQTNMRRRINYFIDLQTNHETIRQIRQINATQYFKSSLSKIYCEFIKIQFVFNRNNRIQGSYGQLCFFLVHRISLGIALYAAFTGRASVGALTAFLFAGNTIIGALNTFIINITNVKIDELVINQLKEFLFNSTDEVWNKQITLDQSFSIEFKNVSYKYPGTDRLALNNVSFTIKSNTKVALVGHNASGKSTLVRLLLGLSEPTNGNIFVNGHDLKKLSLSQYRSYISVVLQQYSKYYLTIGENISISNINEINDFLKIEESARKSNSDFISHYSSSYNQKIGNIYKDGIELSEGQWQKLAIARGYFKESQLFIMDEPTASLDPITEMEIYKQFISLSKKRTSIMISHRLGVCTLADQIIFLDNGELLEEGSHNELMATGGAYSKLFLLQANLYRNPA